MKNRFDSDDDFLLKKILETFDAVIAITYAFL